MARPRIFISSTFFDLRQVRADLDRFIEEMGYIAVRNETGMIPYGNEQKLEEYCYKEISEIEILVGIVGGRFGSEAENQNYSITQLEIKKAIDNNKQVYIFIEKKVLAEYETYLLNVKNKDVKYKHVNDIRIFKFIEEIYALPQNNIVFDFETAQNIITILREQWGGLFRDLLIHRSRKNQFENIDQKVNELTGVASTIKTYLEKILEDVAKSPTENSQFISKEKEKLELFQKLSTMSYVKHLEKTHKLKFDTIIEGIKNSSSIQDLILFFQKHTAIQKNFRCLLGQSIEANRNVRALNDVRIELDEKPYPIPAILIKSTP